MIRSCNSSSSSVYFLAYAETEQKYNLIGKIRLDVKYLLSVEKLKIQKKFFLLNCKDKNAFVELIISKSEDMDQIDDISNRSSFMSNATSLDLSNLSSVDLGLFQGENKSQKMEKTGKLINLRRRSKRTMVNFEDSDEEDLS